jgi:precorrin-4 methylase
MGLETIAAVASIASAASSVKSAFTKPKTSNAAVTAEADLNAQTEDTKRKKALQAAQRKPVETMLTGGQGLTGTAAGAKLG